MQGKLIAASYGGGTNSTALLVGLHERGIRPDIILFADTGGEKPHTYRHLDVVQEWLRANDMPAITVVQQVNRAQQPITLEGVCLKTSSLPSLAYGWKSCSQKHKIAPQDKYLNNLPATKKYWKAGHKVTKLIGYDAGERRRYERAKKEDDKYLYEFPLVEWEWGREECVEAIKRAGLPQPGKSACFFCPASTKPEIQALVAEYPDLAARALAIEDKARPGLTSVKGLGRRFSWSDYLSGLPVPAGHVVEQDCGCYDG